MCHILCLVCIACCGIAILLNFLQKPTRTHVFPEIAENLKCSDYLKQIPTKIFVQHYCQILAIKSLLYIMQLFKHNITDVTVLTISYHGNIAPLSLYFA